MRKGYWTTREGKTMRIRDMTNSHLQNTIAILERQAPARRYSMASAMSHYSDAHDTESGWIVGQEVDRLLEGKDAADVYPKLHELREELERRCGSGKIEHDERAK